MYLRKTIFNFILLFSLLGISNSSISQNPGNVGTANLTGWFRADDLNLGDVTNWTTTFPTGGSAISVNDNTAPYPQLVNTGVVNPSNYNKTILFENNTLAALQALENTNNLNLLDNGSFGDESSFFAVYYLPTATQNDHMVLYNKSSTDGLQFRNLGAKCRLAIGSNQFQTLNASRDYMEEYKPAIGSYVGNRSSNSSLSVYHNSLESNPAVASQSSGGTGLYFGVMPGNANSPLNGYLHEVIFYNKDLSIIEVQKVHSYLAVKYGITLFNTGGGTQGDYVNTQNDLVWDADHYDQFHNDVIGIARDDDQGLLQKQSHSFDDSARVYLDNLSTTNENNGGIVTNNFSYLMIGNNQGLLCASANTFSEVPFGFGINTRLDREWKITKTNFTEVFNLQLVIQSCPFNDNLDPSKLKLLVSQDDDFTNATVYNQGDNGLNFEYLNNTVFIENISDVVIPNNSTQFIAIAYDEESIVIESLPEICETDSLKIKFHFPAAIDTLNVILDDGVNAMQYTDFANGDSIYVHPTQNTTYKAWITSMPMNCCGQNMTPDKVQFTVVINNNPIVDLGNDTTICENANLLLDANFPGSVYEWNTTEISQQITVNTVGSYDVIVTTTDGCIGKDTINVLLDQVVDAGQDVIADHCNSENNIQLNDYLTTSELTGIWSETSLNPSNAFDAVNADLNVNGLQGGTYTFKYELTSVYCPNDEALISINVAVQPNAGSDIQIDICNDEMVVLDDLLSTNVTTGLWEEKTPQISGGFDNVAHSFNAQNLLPDTYYFNYITDEISPCPRDTAELSIQVKPIPQVDFMSMKQEGCNPEQNTFINLSNALSQNANCQWEISDGRIINGCNDISLSFDEVGCYDVKLTVDENGCENNIQKTAIFCVRPVPDADFYVNPEEIFLDEPVANFVNTSNDASIYSWEFGDGTVSNEYEPSHTYDDETPDTYSVKLSVENEYGCKDSVYHDVVVNDITLFYVPNAFTPNDDGYNQVFKPVMTSGFDPYDYQLQIFNRWGELLFVSQNATVGWDGTYRGQLLSDDVYVWVITFGSPYTEDKTVQKGSVTLIK